VSGIAFVALVLGAGLDPRADFAGAFQEAKGLFDRKEYQAAAQAFERLAATAPNARGEAASISLAAISLGRLKQVDRAIGMARTIKAKPMSAYTQMEILSDNRKPRELIAAFENEDIATWPDDINHLGFLLRGGACSAVGDARAALADFERCVRLAGSDVWVKLEALNNVAALHHDLGDDAKAIETYRKALAIYEEEPARKGRWLYPQALLGAARILMTQGKHDDASAILARFGDTSDKNRRNVWGFLILEAYGDILAAQGRKADALAKYEDAATINTHPSHLDRVHKKIETLKNAPRKTLP
jgi:tetratricopeptide (TPR) repeat protein